MTITRSHILIGSKLKTREIQHHTKLLPVSQNMFPRMTIASLESPLETALLS